jgi:hypothetical protein
MAVYVNEVFTGTAGTEIDTTKWTHTKVAGGAGVYYAASGTEGELYSHASASAYAYAVNTSAATTSMDLTIKVRKGASTNVVGTVGIMASGAVNNVATGIGLANGFYFTTATAGGNFVIQKRVAGTLTVLYNSTAFAINTTRWVRLQYDAATSTFRAKCWLDGTTEPSTWLVTDTQAMSSGKALIGSKNTSTTAGSVFVDDLTSYDAPQVVVVDVNTTAGVVGTASAAMTETAFSNASVTKSATADTSSNSGTASTLSFGAGVSNPTFKFDVSEFTAPVAKALFTFYSGGTKNFTVQSVDTSWTESNTSVTPGATSFGSYSGVFGTNTVDITALVNQWIAGTRTNNGFMLLTADEPGTDIIQNVTSREATSNQPALTISYTQLPVGVNNAVTPATATAVAVQPAVVLGITVNNAALPATASAAAVQPTVLLGTGTTQVVAPATATAAIVDPTVSAGANISVSVGVVGTATAAIVQPTVQALADPNVTVAVAPATASAAMPGGVYTAPTVINATSMVAAAAIVEPVLITEKNAIVFATPATASANIVPAEEAAEVGYGPYASRILSQSDDSDIWLRLDETSGTVAYNEMPTRPDATYVGAPTLGVFGLENRRVVSLDGVGQYINLPDTNTGSRNGSMEIVFKTADANGSLMYGNDNAVANPTTGIGTTGADFITAVNIVDGKVQVQFTGNYSFTGTKAVNDNAWHHVVVTWQNTRLQVFLDGKLHFQRHLLEGRNIIAVPDTVGVGLNGQIMEFVFHDENVLSENDAIGNYYAAFGIVPFAVPAMTATATITQGSKGRGNRKRALGLWYKAEPVGSNQVDHYEWTGIIPSENGVREPHLNQYGEPVPFDMGEFKVFPKSIQREESLDTEAYLGGLYYDEVTGEPRYIDISSDIDASDYDLVFFINMPPRINTGGQYGTEPANTVRLYEDMIEGVRKAQDEGGFSLWVPQPDLAVALGIVDRVEAHSMMRESVNTNDQGNAAGLYDARAAQVNPWDGDPANGRYYFDNHALNRYRVTAKVDGLTDLGGYIDTDMYYGRPRDPFKPSFFGWKLKQLTAGLQIGDEFMYGSQDEYDQNHESNRLGAALDRYTVVAVPPTAVKAGTVVTRENAYHYMGTIAVENPFKEYATSIVVEPGDSVAGRPVGGRIFVNFMEGQEALGWTTYTKQLVPGNDVLNPLDAENDEKRAWDYSSARTSIYQIGAAGKPGAPIDNTQANASGYSSTGSPAVVGISISEKYPTTSVRRYGLLERAFNWLAKKVSVAVGDKIIRPAAATAVASMPQPGVNAQASTTIAVQAASATATIVKPANVADPNVSVNVLPMTARADMTGYGKTIAVEPATAYAEMVESFDVVHAGGEQIVLTLHHVDATLYLLEEA